MLPNFIIAGGVATGTSFLSAMLSYHPDIYLPRIQRPEPNFFHYSWKYNKGIEWYQHTWFHEVGTQKAIGERSSLLLPSDFAASRLKQINPDIKLIFCLRSPTERAWANYRFTVLEGLEPLCFDEAIECEDERIKQYVGTWAEVMPHAYLKRSHYSTHLQQFIELFGRDQILLLKSEDLGRLPHENVRRVCDFLGVKSSLQLPLPANYSSPSVIDRDLQIELRNFFGDRFPSIVECIRTEQDFSALALTLDDKINIKRLQANLRSSKDFMPQSSRDCLRHIFSDEIVQMRNLVDFTIEDWA